MAWVSRGAWFTIGAALVVGGIAMAFAAGRVLLLVLIAVILAAGLEPLIAWIRGRFRLSRGPAILVVYGAFLVAVVGLVTIVLPAAIAQFGGAIDRLPSFLDRIGVWAAGLQPPPVAASIVRLVDAARRMVAPSSANLPSTTDVMGVGLTVAEMLVTTVTILAVVYYWLVEHARLQRFALAFVPEHRRAGVRATWNEVENRLGMWVRGQLILMLAIGIATAAACTILGVPGALLLGLVSAVTEAIPLVGPFLGAVPAVVMAATVSPQLALAVAGVYLVLQLIEGNVLVPVVMRHNVGISPFLVILSLLVGGAVGGLLGAFLGVPVAAAIELMAEGLQAREEPVAQDPTAIVDQGDDARDDPIDGPGAPLTRSQPELPTLSARRATTAEPGGVLFR